MSQVPAPKEQAPVSASLIALEKEARWLEASAEEREVLKRITMQRDRLSARKAAFQQAAQLRKQATAVSPDAPLVERITTFARLHPAASAGLLGVALFLGPKRIFRLGMTLVPLLAKFRR